MDQRNDVRTLAKGANVALRKFDVQLGSVMVLLDSVGTADRHLRDESLLESFVGAGAGAGADADADVTVTVRPMPSVACYVRANSLSLA